MSILKSSSFLVIKYWIIKCRIIHNLYHREKGSKIDIKGMVVSTLKRLRLVLTCTSVVSVESLESLDWSQHVSLVLDHKSKCQDTLRPSGLVFCECYIIF